MARFCNQRHVYFLKSKVQQAFMIAIAIAIQLYELSTLRTFYLFSRSVLQHFYQKVEEFFHRSDVYFFIRAVRVANGRAE